MSTLLIILVPLICLTPSLIFNYLHFKKNKQDKIPFILINCVAALCVLTLYLAHQLPN